MLDTYQLLESVMINRTPQRTTPASVECGHIFKSFKPSVHTGFQPNENFIVIQVTSFLTNNGKTQQFSTETRLRVETAEDFNIIDHLTNENVTNLLTRMFLTAQQEHNDIINREVKSTGLSSRDLRFESPKYFNELIKNSLSALFN